MTTGASREFSQWQHAETAAAVLAVDPHGLGGISLRAFPGPIRETWLETFRDLLPDGTPWRRVPLHTSESRLLGGIDLSATLRSGTPVAETGLLAEADGGVVLLAMAERAARKTVAHLCTAVDQGELRLERDGLRGRSPSRFGVIALDEGLEDESMSPALCDRLALALDLHPLGIRDVDGPHFSDHDVQAARARLAGIALQEAHLRSLALAALALGIDSPRALVLASRCTRILAALARRDATTEADLAAAVKLTLAHRATRLPVPPDAEEAAEAPPPESEASSKDDTNEPSAESPQPLQEQLLDAAAAVIPPGLLAQLQSGAQSRHRHAGQGKSGAQQSQRLRGRPAGVTPGDPREGARLNLIATLRAAAPWQPIRRARADRDGLLVERQDFRLVRYRDRTPSITIFVVDASGSAALHRLAEAKGAVELLLADCYVRRDEVALVSFRGESAELLLPPTRSLLRAKRSLSALPGGGGTPLASALDMTRALADQVQRRGSTPCFVLLTDGRANIARDGSRGRDGALHDALASSAELKNMDLHGMVIDTSPRPHANAREVARAADAVYLPLPHADAETLRSAVQANSP
ncbi:MAG: magnesium chelatase subunit D [Pseudomonadota bacterium]